MKTKRLDKSIIVASLCFGGFGTVSHAAGGDHLFHDPVQHFARPHLHVKPQLTFSPSGYSVQQIRRAYGFDQVSGTGEGQVIAIIIAFGSPTIQADLDTFSATYRIPSTTLGIFYPQGIPQNNHGSWAAETSLDVEWAHAIAPGATILVVAAKSPSLGDLVGAVDFAVNLGATQVSMSWGGPEFASETNFDFHFNRPGVSFFASSGDTGAGVDWPAASPNVVSVGGTSLQLDAEGNVIAETAWSGSGGGSSAYEFRPAYQVSFQFSSGRGVPDVSFNGDPNTGIPVYIGDYFGSAGWITVGGTSAGTPQWAALAALVNAGQSQLSGPWNAVLYSMATTNYSFYYRDIVSGNNGPFNAIVGYDFVTGLGRPIANLFAGVPSSRVVTVKSNGFENPDAGENTYLAFSYNPPQIPGLQMWQFDGTAGVTGNGSGFTVSNSPAPEGKQVAFIQMDTGVISQSINIPATGNYQLSLLAALRSEWDAGPQIVQVYLDDALIGSFSPEGAEYQNVAISFTAASGERLLSFRGTATYDSTAFIDNVAISAQ